MLFIDYYQTKIPEGSKDAASGSNHQVHLSIHYTVPGLQSLGWRKGGVKNGYSAAKAGIHFTAYLMGKGYFRNQV